MALPKVLIVEDERALAKVLRFNLEREGYAVASAEDGEAGLEAFAAEKPDLVILDLMLPKLDGFEFCKAVRKGSRTPILMLTARKEEVDRVLGLELGADDYVTKPFSVREVLARVKAILRRTRAPSGGGGPVRAGALEVDLERYEVTVAGKTAVLSTKEFELLRCLLAAEGKALSRDEIMEKVWGYDRALEIDTRTVDQHVARLRDKLGDEARRVVTVKNVGYRLKRD
ncbi:MAG: response regulator transcription factor [Elusimicrobia bacterium]|nr:response regulator transcription factor [Elusimicrobiota bacterium]